jgi:hypothetical protein
MVASFDFFCVPSVALLRGGFNGWLLKFSKNREVLETGNITAKKGRARRLMRESPVLNPNDR